MRTTPMLIRIMEPARQQLLTRCMTPIGQVERPLKHSQQQLEQQYQQQPAGQQKQQRRPESTRVQLPSGFHRVSKGEQAAMLMHVLSGA